MILSKWIRSWHLVVVLILLCLTNTSVTKEIDSEKANTFTLRKRQLGKDTQSVKLNRRGGDYTRNEDLRSKNSKKRFRINKSTMKKDNNSSAFHSGVYNLNDDEMETLNSIIDYIQRPLLNKTVFSPTKRLLFVVGLEGAGHHMAAALMRQCRLYAGNVTKLQKLCIGGGKIPELFRVVRNKQVSHNGVRNDRHYGLFGSSGYVNHGKYLVEVHKLLVQLAKNEAFHGPFFMHINGKDSPLHGMLSYPNYDGVNRNLHNPDLHVLAAVAESAGVDLRLLVLQRSASELYESASDRFNVTTPLMSMSNSASNLFSQLYRVDPAFFACVPYHDFGSCRGVNLASLHFSSTHILLKKMQKFSNT